MLPVPRQVFLGVAAENPKHYAKLYDRASKVVASDSDFPQVSIKSLSVQFGCLQLEPLATLILKRYQERIGDKLPIGVYIAFYWAALYEKALSMKDLGSLSKEALTPKKFVGEALSFAEKLSGKSIKSSKDASWVAIFKSELQDGSGKASHVPTNSFVSPKPLRVYDAKISREITEKPVILWDNARLTGKNDSFEVWKKQMVSASED